MDALTLSGSQSNCFCRLFLPSPYNIWVKRLEDWISIHLYQMLKKTLSSITMYFLQNLGNCWYGNLSSLIDDCEYEYNKHVTVLKS